MTPAETTAELIRILGGSAAAEKYTGIGAVTLRRIASGKITPRDRLANALAWNLERVMEMVS
jgi:hypothetical protein